MSTIMRDAGVKEASCRECGHDLIASRGKDGKVFCSNTGCHHHRKSHPTGQEPNDGLAKA